MSSKSFALPAMAHFCPLMIFATVATTPMASSAEQRRETVNAPTHIQADRTESWVVTWAASPQLRAAQDGDLPDSIANRTIRQIVHISARGARVRITVSNEFGASPLLIGKATVAVSIGGSRINPLTLHILNFKGARSIAIPPGESEVSDPVDLKVASLSDLTISLYLPKQTRIETVHEAGLQTSYLGRHGDLTTAPAISNGTPFSKRLFLTEVDVQAESLTGAIVAFGDSITDGGGSTPDCNRRWPDLLAELLTHNLGEMNSIAVANAGIGGNALLHSAVYGGLPNNNPSALARFERDALTLAGVKTIVLLEGSNDLSSIGVKIDGELVSNPTQAATVDDMIGGYRQIVVLAHRHGIRVIGATIMPFEDAGKGKVENAWNPDKEMMRSRINQWIRDSKIFDGIVDFDAVMRDPVHPARLLPRYDSGDHAHPNDTGHAALADAVYAVMFGPDPK